VSITALKIAVDPHPFFLMTLPSLLNISSIGRREQAPIVREGQALSGFIRYTGYVFEVSLLSLLVTSIVGLPIFLPQTLLNENLF
jgi:hypothetical protein